MSSQARAGWSSSRLRLSEDWGASFAQLAADLPLNESKLDRRKIVTQASPKSAEPGPMVSWIIAPRTQRRFPESL